VIKLGNHDIAIGRLLSTVAFDPGWFINSEGVLAFEAPADLILFRVCFGSQPATFTDMQKRLQSEETKQPHAARSFSPRGPELGGRYNATIK
jgi:hypothetical protein